MRNLILIVVLGAAAVASWFYSRPLPIETQRRPSGSSEPLGYYLRGARLLGTDASGQIAYSIAADRLEEHPDQERLLLERVHVEYHPPDEVPWVITAGIGSAPKDRSQLDLAGGVQLTSEPTDGSTPVHIATDSLRFEPATSSAVSDERVEIRFGDWHLDAVGLRTHLKDHRLELESDVHGKFAP